MDLGLTPPGYELSPLRGWFGVVLGSHDGPGTCAARLRSVAALRLGWACGRVIDSAFLLKSPDEKQNRANNSTFAEVVGRDSIEGEVPHG